MSSRPHLKPFLAIGVAILVAACGSGPGVSVAPTSAPSSTASPAGSPTQPATGSPSLAPGNPAGDIHLIKHVIVIMQENRSFDTYFGTYPGAVGIPMSGGTPSVCVPDPARGGCDAPFHSTANKDSGGPHNVTNAAADMAGGAMNGFVGQAEHAQKGCAGTFKPSCAGTGTPDVMGYMDQREIPNYWA